MVLTAFVCQLLLAATYGGAMAASAQGKVRIVALGDSLTAGYLLKPSEAFPVQLEAALKAAGQDVEVRNAGVSGDTTAGGLERLDWSVGEGIDAVILELGANDALQAMDPKRTRTNLDKIIVSLKAKGVNVLLAGMVAPRNLGNGFTSIFDPIYPELAKTHDVLLYPFFLEGVAMDQTLNLGDGLHPNSRGVAKIVNNMMPSVMQLIEQVRKRKGGETRG